MVFSNEERRSGVMVDVAITDCGQSLRVERPAVEDKQLGTRKLLRTQRAYCPYQRLNLGRG